MSILLRSLLIFIAVTLAISYISTKFSDAICFHKRWLYKERSWEKGGQFYQKKFKIKKWKDKLPELADFIKSISPKKYIKDYGEATLDAYMVECCRAELTHWLIILTTLFFPIFTPPVIALYIFILACILNLPFVMIQRYNRPRLRLLMKRKGYGV
jgi:glycosyl-4,4'-diaponeurosporenoate acyltransferase